MKAADIPDIKMLEAVKHEGLGNGANMSDVERRFPDFPPKVVRAKLHALLRRKAITGCCCGCRGDFNLTAKGQQMLEAPVGAY
jgi:hypothetical protein